MRAILISATTSALIVSSTTVLLTRLGGSTQGKRISTESSEPVVGRAPVHGSPGRAAARGRRGGAFVGPSFRSRRSPNLETPAADDPWATGSPIESETSEGNPALEPPPAGEEPTTGIDFDLALGKLLHPSASWIEKESLWEELREAGLFERAVSAFEELANANPKQTEVQVEAGMAYLQKFLSVSDEEKGAWVAKANRAFDAGSSSGKHEWEAAFAKAASLCFSPVLSAREQQAIRELETLLRQNGPTGERTKSSDTCHSLAYLYLGDLYQQQGGVDQAKATWAEGLGLFPESAPLRERVTQSPRD